MSVDCNQFSGPIGLSPTNIQDRADLVLGAIEHFQSLNSGSDLIFGGHIDFSRGGLIGHSRGGEVVLVVPEQLALPSTGISGVKVKGVISIAPTDTGATSGKPAGFAFMTILPAADLDVITNDGAKYYDQASADPFKCQLYVHDANHETCYLFDVQGSGLMNGFHDNLHPDTHRFLLYLSHVPREAFSARRRLTACRSKSSQMSQ